ncbi:hypothetical protein PG990_005173 [Apiospora arundinis]
MSVKVLSPGEDIPSEELRDRQDERYTAFTDLERWIIVAIVCFASLCSNLSAFIFLPALKLLADTFSVTVDQINLVLTVYMAVATVAPTLAGDAADVVGRRPTYLVTLGLFFISDIFLALAKSYEELLGLRVLQALGQSGIIVIGYGVVTDITTPADRGSFMSAVSFAITIAPSLGPILGGALSYAAGWRWIFWLLAAMAGPCLVLVILGLPETARSVVGNGSLQPPIYCRLPVLHPRFMRHWKVNLDTGSRGKRRVPNPLKSLKILLRRDNTVVVLASALMYTVYSCVIASLSTLFIEIYGLNQWQAGLAYLPFGVGGTFSTFVSGPLLNWAYRKARCRHDLMNSSRRDDDIDDFPIERARLNVMWAPVLVTLLCILAYGWALHERWHLAVPLALQFVVGFALQFNFSGFNTLISDINHAAPSAANASTALVRCALAALAVAYFENILGAINVGWTFTCIAGLCLTVLGLFSIEYRRGTAWRMKGATWCF